MPAVAPRMNGIRRLALFCTPFLILGVAIGGGIWVTTRLPNEPSGPYGGYLALYNPQPDQHPVSDGAALYAQNCAHCHGINGDGNGTTPLAPKARYFAFEKFKFTDTLNQTKTGGGTPSDENLQAVISRGIAGSPMPSFAHLGEDRIRAIVEHLRSQYIRADVVLQRLKQKLKADVAKDGEDWDEKSDWADSKQAKYRATAISEVQVGPQLELPGPFPETTPESVGRGRIVFEKLGCVSCHGSQGKGDGPQAQDAKFINENGTRAYPRDLTAGVYKGGGEVHDLFRRVYLGIPGTPMPANGVTASKQEIIDVVHYVRSLPVQQTTGTQNESSHKLATK
jgi:mono/diheme cytochrome c family protein